MKPNTKAYKQHMEQEAIIEEMADAMRKAHLAYVGESGRMTPKMEMTWHRYLQFAMRVSNVRSVPCGSCGKPRLMRRPA